MVDSINSINPQGIITEAEAVPRKISSPNFRANEYNAYVRSPDEDTFEDSSSSKGKVTAGVIGTIIVAAGLIWAGRKGHLGEKVQEFLGGAKKTSKNAKPEGKPEIKSENKDYENWLKEQSEAKKAIEESNQRNEKWVEEQSKLKEEEYSNWWNKELTAKEEAEKVAKEAEEKAKLEAEKAAKKAEEKAKLEAKKAIEKSQAEYTAEMDKIANDKAIELKNKWNQKIDTFTAIYRKGFKAISRGKETSTLEDGTFKAVSNNKKGSIEYYSKNGSDLDSIRVLDKDGKIMSEVGFGRDQGKTGDLTLFDSNGKITEGMSFSTKSRKNGNRLARWYICNGFRTKGLKSLYIDGNGARWNALPPEKVANGLSLTNWINLK